MENPLSVGDKVMWRGSWGKDAPKETRVTTIEMNCGSKHGDNVQSIEWSKVIDRSIVVDLSNGHWAYGNQITKL